MIVEENTMTCNIIKGLTKYHEINQNIFQGTMRYSLIGMGIDIPEIAVIPASSEM